MRNVLCYSACQKHQHLCFKCMKQLFRLLQGNDITVCLSCIFSWIYHCGTEWRKDSFYTVCRFTISASHKHYWQNVENTLAFICFFLRALSGYCGNKNYYQYNLMLHIYQNSDKYRSDFKLYFILVMYIWIITNRLSTASHLYGNIQI